MLNRRSLPLSSLRAFESAGRHLHLGRAGAELGVTHGAVSHQVRALESNLGVKLFRRANNRLQLTSAGERLLASVSEGFDCIANGALHLNPDSTAGELVIGCTQSAGASWVINYIMQFQARYPQMDIRVVEVQPLQRDIPSDIDAAICYGEPKIDNRRLEFLLAPEVFPVCSPALLYDREPIRRPEQLLELRLLDDTQNNWSHWLSTFGVEANEPAVQTHFFSTGLALSAARNGYGVALCNPLEIQDDLREGKLVRMLEHSIPESQKYYLLCNPVAEQSLREQLFENWIRSVF